MSKAPAQRSTRLGGLQNSGISRRASRVEVIGICSSTGGPQALAKVLRPLPADFEPPILVVQHMLPGFIDGLVNWLDAETALSVSLAFHGQQLSSGVWFAPDDAHMTLRKDRRLSLDRISVEGSHRPSGDILLRSLADVAGAGAVAVILTGMGRDGAEGLASVADAGGHTIAQDQKSSVVYGMPRVAAERGAKTILSVEAIAAELISLDRRGRR